MSTMKSRIFLVVLAVAFATSALADDTNPLVPFPSPLTAASGGGGGGGGGNISGTCATANAIAYFSAATTLTCNATLTTDGSGGLLVGGNTTLGDASGDVVRSNAATWTFPSDTAVSLGGGVNGFNIDNNTLSIDAGNHRVGIGTAAPGVNLEINGGAANTFVRALNSSSAAATEIIASAESGAETAVFDAVGSTFVGNTFGTPSAGNLRLFMSSGSTGGTAVKVGADLAVPVILGNRGPGDGTGMERFRLDGTTGNVIVNALQAANVDFQVEGQTNANALYVDVSADAVGFGTSTPGAPVTVDNKAVAGPIVTARDNGTNVWVLQDGGLPDSRNVSATTDAGTGSCTAVTVSGNNVRGTITATCVLGQTVVMNFGAPNWPAAPICVFGAGGEQTVTSASSTTVKADLGLTGAKITYECTD